MTMVFVMLVGTLLTVRALHHEPRRVDPTRASDSTRFVRLYTGLPSDVLLDVGGENCLDSIDHKLRSVTC